MASKNKPKNPSTKKVEPTLTTPSPTLVSTPAEVKETLPIEQANPIQLFVWPEVFTFANTGFKKIQIVDEFEKAHYMILEANKLVEIPFVIAKLMIQYQNRPDVGNITVETKPDQTFKIENKSITVVQQDEEAGLATLTDGKFTTTLPIKFIQALINVSIPEIENLPKKEGISKIKLVPAVAPILQNTALNNVNYRGKKFQMGDGSQWEIMAEDDVNVHYEFIQNSKNPEQKPVNRTADVSKEYFEAMVKANAFRMI